jgi:hypothetical protein
MHLAMAARKAAPPPKQAGPAQINLRVPPETLEALDAWVESINETRSWPKVNRSDVLRSLLDWGLKEQPDWVGK